MNKSVFVFTVAILSLVSGVWVAQALGQVSVTPSSGIGDKISNAKTSQAQVSVPGIPAQFDLETRVDVLERQVAQLQSQVNQLTARVSELDVSIVGPASSDPGYSGPRLKVPIEKKND